MIINKFWSHMPPGARVVNVSIFFLVELMLCWIIGDFFFKRREGKEKIDLVDLGSALL